jgi:hypothetical protein
MFSSGASCCRAAAPCVTLVVSSANVSSANLWSSEQTCVVNLVDRDAVIDKLVYTASKPVADHLVDRVHHAVSRPAPPPVYSVLGRAGPVCEN